ncbi:ATP-dependent RNA helicase DbpA [Marinospirillum insulare]|uniref:ATP-dependent RNA helicase n=1 Tax=Marinospirillum insulare TaxID=217169 RepID=A0ABQ6A128_9GAMM|nr:ATP-dependent RNA helicase DbpA [Marinospirillum insulare]GLR64267.1 ATP-dependent RNA helicase [Marinospirillum insulare]
MTSSLTTSAFASLSLQTELLANLATLGYNEMTEIQSAALPKILAGQDVIAQAKTGSGKTAAFGLGLLQKLEVERFRIQTLVLCPTRELADQVAVEIRRLARAMHNVKVLTLCGGQPFGPQAHSLEHGAHIIVGTPGRIDDHLNKGNLNLENVKMLVLDEADRMLDMGFQEVLDAIVEQLPQQRQTLLFSATFPEKITSLAGRLLTDPEQITVEANHTANSIKQHFYKLNSEAERFTALRLLLLHYAPESSVIFCTTRKETQDLADGLSQLGFSAQALHGDMEQKDRDQTLVQFANKSISILVATDVAARGLDIAALDMVFNYQLSLDPEVHVHRVGRTGRAGEQGIACTLYSAAEEFRLAALADYLQQSLETEALPDEKALQKQPKPALMQTLLIDGGKKDKLRPTDILGALTAKQQLAGAQIGKINVTARRTFVAVERKIAKQALQLISEGKLKGRSFRARLL